MAGAQITLTIPPRAEFLRLVRLASADVGSRVGLDYEEIDDLKIAASELCSLVLESGDSLTLVFTLEDDTVTIDGAASLCVLSENEISRAIISAVVDEYEIRDVGDKTQFRLMKRHRT